ncbi:MAG: diaminopimelate decarboxylase [Oscillospiraceae bacterium]|nr:diaminopimelate decarboxylase [Oscillospiraceae bacterium]
MFLSDCLSVNAAGHLAIDDADAVALAQRFGTPLYCLSEAEIRRACRTFADALQSCFPQGSFAAYAGKALCCRELLRIVQSEGLGLDVVSGGELYTAASVGFAPEKILFHGNNKTPAELADALEYGVGTIVVDNLFELETLAKLCAARGRRQDIFLRIKPGVEAHTHKYILTGSIDSKFGFALENGEADDAVARAASCGALRLTGLHCHIGSQIFEAEPFCEAARVMLRFMKRCGETHGIAPEKLDLGGGYAIKYLPENTFTPAKAMIGTVARAIEAECAALGMPVPQIILEPGRRIVGSAGVTLYTVGAVKEIRGVRTYVSVDGGMTDNPRYALYQADYTAVLANKAAQPADRRVTIAGKCCESGDLIQENTLLQAAEPGDILAVLSTGAYNYSMASNYNRIPRPPIVLIRGGDARVIVRRETYEDLLRCDE